jgi:uncharacterized DUF497 family protein
VEKAINDIRDTLLAGSVPDEELKRLAEIHDDDLQLKLKSFGLAANRQKLLYEIIRNKKEVYFYVKIDIQRYVLKRLFPEEYNRLSLGHHLYSSSELYEYDPPKNGENIIKHGFNFSEIMSYSGNSGAYIVACPDKFGGTRHVMFSTVDSETAGRRLDFPMPAVDGKVVVMSVGQMVGLKFRFISARFLSPNSYEEIIKRAIKNIYVNEPEARDEFIRQCVSAIKERFFLSLP